MRTFFSSHSTRLLTASVVVALLVSACSSPVTGTPAALPTTIAPEIAVPISPYNDWFRTLDPCGFVDGTTIAQWGVPIHFGNDTQMDTCSIEFAEPVTDARIEGLSVSTGMGVDSTFVDLGGFMGTELPDSVMCSISVRFDDHQSYFVSAFGADFGLSSPELFGNSVDARLCSRTRELIRASVPLFSSQPLRSESTRSVQTALMSKQPCGAVPELSRTYPKTTATTLREGDPFNCRIQTGVSVNKRDESGEVNIGFRQFPESMADEPLTMFGEVEINLLGVVGHEEEEDNGYCTTRAFVGVGSGYPVQRRTETETYIDVIQLSGFGCERLRIAATAAVRAYQNG